VEVAKTQAIKKNTISGIHALVVAGTCTIDAISKLDHRSAAEKTGFS
jgi:hypothetical protein